MVEREHLWVPGERLGKYLGSFPSQVWLVVDSIFSFCHFYSGLSRDTVSVATRSMGNSRPKPQVPTEVSATQEIQNTMTLCRLAGAGLGKGHDVIAH